MEKSPDRSGDRYEIVSTFAYLIGVGFNIFENKNGTLSPEIFSNLENNRAAKIIRNLCITRTLMVSRFSAVCHAIQREYKSITSIPDIIPTDIINYLNLEGIHVYSNNRNPNQFLTELHLEIKNRLNNCRELFPDWINWSYISDLFIFPEKITDDYLKKIAAVYYGNKQFYPYQVFMHWESPSDLGNILASDQRFLRLVYEWHGDKLSDLSLVSDVKSGTKSQICNFIDSSNNLIFIVDCENSDPYSLCAALNGLDKGKTDKISKIILYDDVHAAKAWDMLSDYVTIPIEYILIERLKANKSLADIKIAARISREYYENNTDSFILVSSDSDYWGMMEELPDTRFLVMAEKDKFSFAMKEALRSRNVFYCYIEDFYSGNNSKIKATVLIREVNRILSEHFKPLTVSELVDKALINTRMGTDDTTLNSAIVKYMKSLHVEISDEGQINIRIGN